MSDADVYAWMLATKRGYLAAARLAAKHFGIDAQQAREIYRSQEASPRPATAPPPPPMPPTTDERPSMEFPPATIPEPEHEPGSVESCRAQLRDIKGAFDRAVGRTDRIDAQGVASLARAMRESEDRLVEALKARAAHSSTGLALDQRLARCAEAARKMPNMMLEIFVLQWCQNNRIDMAALREAKLVRAGEDGA